jgi:hypothetical protein
MTTGLDNSFMHTAGQKRGPYSKPCQMFMSDYCSNNWDGICEVASKNTNSNFPNTVMSLECDKSIQGDQFTQGENLIRNTASKKYLSKMSSNCSLTYEPFDPMVPTSPMISSWHSEGDESSSCVSVYEVDPVKIDNDPVMNKILTRPMIAIDILTNIYNWANRNNTYNNLKHTKLYKFFESKWFKQYLFAKYPMGI